MYQRKKSENWQGENDSIDGEREKETKRSGAATSPTRESEQKSSERVTTRKREGMIIGPSRAQPKLPRRQSGPINRAPRGADLA